MHFVIQKLKNKHTLLKNIQTEKDEEPLILTEREETKTRYEVLKKLSQNISKIESKKISHVTL